MKRAWVASAVVLCAVFFTAKGAKASGPSASAVREAAASFDSATRAYRAGKFAVAASAYESADSAAPSSKALRMAIRSRFKAKQLARAATLAAWALERHPDDTSTAKLAKNTLSETSSKLHEVAVQCSAPCVLAVDSRGVPGPARLEARLYLLPGRRRVSASFEDGRSAPAQSVLARAGASSSVALTPPKRIEPKAKAKPKPKAKPTKVATPATKVAAKTALQRPAPASPSETDRSATAESGQGWYTSPVLFGVFAVSTLGLGAATIYSGVDTLENPGPDAVADECAGQGASCPLYQEALAKQTRTNILIGATIGAGVLSLATGVFLTEWDDDDVTVGVAPLNGGVSFSLGGRL